VKDLNALADKNGYGLLLVLGLVLFVAYFVLRDAALLWTGTVLAVAGAAGQRLKSISAGPKGVSFEQYRARTVAAMTRRIASPPVLSQVFKNSLAAGLKFEGSLDAVKISGAESVNSSTEASTELLKRVSAALEAPTPEDLGYRLVDLGLGLPSDFTTVAASEHMTPGRTST